MPEAVTHSFACSGRLAGGRAVRCIISLPNPAQSGKTVEMRVGWAMCCPRRYRAPSWRNLGDGGGGGGGGGVWCGVLTRGSCPSGTVAPLSGCPLLHSLARSPHGRTATSDHQPTTPTRVSNHGHHLSLSSCDSSIGASLRSRSAAATAAAVLPAPAPPWLVVWIRSRHVRSGSPAPLVRSIWSRSRWSLAHFRPPHSTHPFSRDDDARSSSSFGLFLQAGSES
ncbi:hypothetical protein IWX49DRAFT_417969 [Phyllosticta citricarpa]|uniref:Uncharacterized protein n=1 Tax=Phyllosticta citricarpa TaxID=55181 RepID=A0ABR1MDP8_9PEZI